MKDIFLTAIFAACFFCASSQKNPPFKIEHLTGDFYIYTTYQDVDGSPYPANGMYMVTDSGVVMIDSPWNADEAPALLDSIELKHHKKVVLCIATHFHADRTGGFAALKKRGVKTYTSVLTNQFCKARKENEAQYYFLNDTTFSVGNCFFNTYYPGAGHSKDNIVIWFPEDKILYGGCFIKSTEAPTLGNLSDANITEWRISIKKVISHFPSTSFVIPGHQMWDNGMCISHTQKLLLIGAK